MFYLLIDIVILLTVVSLALLGPIAAVRWWRPWRRQFLRLANRPWISILSVGLFVLAIEVGFGLLVHFPAPAEDDEFSYLLAADTFAHGRLTNPPHPLWEHFETYNIIHQPSYQSKFPPGQGLVLAAGQILSGRPVVGVWLNTALACAAICWMLYGWLPPRWALTGGILAATHVGIVRFWGHDYMGGGVALLGGALLYGALPRVLRTQRVGPAVAMAAGVALLANSRPYEGAIACLPAAVLLVAWFARQPNPIRMAALKQVVLPTTLVLAATGTWMAYYNYRVTGDPWRMPYQVWVDTYSPETSLPGPLLFTIAGDRVPDAKPPRTVGMAPGAAQWEIWNQRRTNVVAKLFNHWSFYFRVVLTPTLLVLPYTLRNRWMRFAGFTCALVLAAIVLENTHGFAHYAAPIAGLIFLLIVQGLRQLRLWKRGDRPVGRLFAPLLVTAYVLSFGIWLVHWAREPVRGPDQWGVARENVERQLAASGDQHLVLVRYPHSEDGVITWNEWVHNGAEIDSQPVIWARDAGETANQDLLSYYGGRRVWVLELDKQRLSPLTASPNTIARKEP